MAFDQFKLDRSSLQTRDIFNRYVYETPDTKADIQAAGYFSQSRLETASPDFLIHDLTELQTVIEAQ